MSPVLIELALSTRMAGSFEPSAGIDGIWAFESAVHLPSIPTGAANMWQYRCFATDKQVDFAALRDPASARILNGTNIWTTTLARRTRGNQRARLEPERKEILHVGSLDRADILAWMERIERATVRTLALGAMAHDLVDDPAMSTLREAF